MGSEAEAETRERRSTTPPKLLLFSRIPHQSSEESLAPTAAGMLTPPLRPPASVPFLWEEAPGKPLPTCTVSSSSSTAATRCLELPPRLQLMESRFTSNNKMYSSSNRMPSPTTVLDGPYVGQGRSSSFTCSTSFSRDLLPPPPSLPIGSFRPTDDSEGDGILQPGQRRYNIISSSGYFGSWGRKAAASSYSRRNQDVGEGSFVISRSSSSSSSGLVLGVGFGEIGGSGGGGGTINTNTKVKITRFKSRTGSFLSLPLTKSSHLWTSIYEGLKQVIPWRSRKTKKDAGLIV